MHDDIHVERLHTNDPAGDEAETVRLGLGVHCKSKIANGRRIDQDHEQRAQQPPRLCVAQNEVPASPPECSRTR